MPYIFLILVMSIIFARTEVLNTETYIEKKAHDKVYESMIDATHDAALQINITNIMQGKIDFDEAEANKVFKKTLSKNLPLDTSLNPLNHYIISKPIDILNVAFIDDNYIDPSTGKTVTYPFKYQYVDPASGKNFTKVVDGPSVIYIIKTQLAYTNYPYYIAKSYEYRGF